MTEKNSCRLRGNLTAAPKFMTLRDSGVPFMRFYLAVPRDCPSSSDGDDGGDRRQAVDYFQVVSYGRRAARDYPFLRKGSEVLVEGWLRMRMVPNGNGRSQRIYEVVAENILFLHNIAWPENKGGTRGL
jgi:single stranded DNA-binding protein